MSDMRAVSDSRSVRRGERGLSLLELTVMLGALVVVSAALTPAALRMLHDSRQNDVYKELAQLHMAILGSDKTGTFGYVGDLGRVPYRIEELVGRMDEPLYALDAATGVGYGWNGPYVNAGRDADDYRTDPWGNAYDVGVAGVGQLRSAGPDGVYDTSDDILVPPNPVNIYGSVLVSISGVSDSVVTTNPDGCTVTLQYAADGIVSSVIDETVPYSFSDVHRGLHAIQVRCLRLDGAGETEQSTVLAVRGGGAQQVVEVYVELASTVEAAAAEESEQTAAQPGEPPRGDQR